MSSVDNRVVKLTFDNEQFERGVSKSMSTLDKFEEQLQFKKSATGLSNLQRSINTIDFGRFANAIEGINSKLSATGVMAATVVARITNSLIDGAAKIENATIGQIKSGGWNRAMNIENAKFSIQGLKGDWDQLYKAMDYAVTGTAYGIDQAAKAASTLLASQVDYQKVIETNGSTQITMMHKALRAISGVAAQTNSSFDDISRIFTTVAGQGRLMSEQLNQLASRGMNAAAILGEQLHMTEAQVREATSKGAIDFATFSKAMDDAFGEHATDANKTFNGAFSNMKAALSRFGAVFATPIIQKTNTFFIALTDRIKEMKNAISDVTKNGEVVTEKFESHFAQMWEQLIKFSDYFIHKVDLEWFKNIADGADKIVVRLKNLFEALNNIFGKAAEKTTGTVKKVYDLANITKEELDLVEGVIKGIYGNGAKRRQELNKYIQDNEINTEADKIQQYVNKIVAAGWSFDKTGIKIKEFGDANKEVIDDLDNFERSAARISIAMNNFKAAGDNTKAAFGAVWKALNPLHGLLIVFDELRVSAVEFSQALSQFTYYLKPTYTELEQIKTLGEYVAEGISEVIAEFRRFGVAILSVARDTLKLWHENGELEQSLKNINRTLAAAGKIFRNVSITITRFVKAVLTAFLKVLSPSQLTGYIAGFAEGLAEMSDSFVLTEEGAAALTDTLVTIFTTIKEAIGFVADLGAKVFEFFTGLKKTDSEMEDSADSAEDMSSGFEKVDTIGTKILELFKKIPKAFTDLSDALEENEGIIRLKKAISELWETTKKSVSDGVKPLASALGEVGEATGKTITVKDVADAIGWVADKLAYVVENIPSWITTIEEYFGKAKDAIVKFFDDLSKNEHWMEFEKNVVSTFSNTDEITGSISKTFGGIGDFIFAELDKVDWEKVGDSALLVGALALIFKLTQVADAVNTMFTSVVAIPKAITLVIKSFGTFMTVVNKSLTKFTTALLIGSIAAAIVGIVASIALIADIPADDLNRAAAVVVLVAGIIWAIVKAFTKLNWAKAAKQLQLNERSALTIFVQSFGIAATVLALGYTLKTMIDSMEQIGELLDKYPAEELQAMALAMGALMIGLLAIALIIFAIGKFIVDRIVKANASLQEGVAHSEAVSLTMIAMAALIAGIGAALYLVAKGMAAITEAGVTSDVIWPFIGMVAAIMLGISIMALATKDVSYKQLGAIAIIILEIALMMGIMLGGIYLMAGIIQLENYAELEDTILKAVGAMTVLLLAIAVSIAIMSMATTRVVKGGKTVSHSGGELVGVMFGMILLVSAVTASIWILTKAINEVGNPDDLFTAIGLFIGVILVLTLLAVVIGSYTANASVDVEKIFAAATLMAAMGTVVVMLAASIWIIADAISTMPDPSTALKTIATMIIVFSVLFGVFAAAISSSQIDQDALLVAAASAVLMSLAVVMLAGAIAALGVTKTSVWTILSFAAVLGVFFVAIHALGKLLAKNKGLSHDMYNIGNAMILMGASLVLLAAAAVLLDDVGWDGILKLGAAMLIAVVAFAALGAISQYLPAVNTAIESIGKVFLMVGAAVLLASAGIWLVSKALWSLAPLFPFINPYLDEFFNILEKHKAMATFVIGVVTIIAVLATVLIAKVLTSVDKVVNAIVTAGTIILDVLKALGSGLVNGIQNFANSTKLKNSTKMVIVTMIASVLSAITEKGPAVLQTFGKLIVMLLDFIADAIGPIIDKLFDILIRIINGLTDAVFSNINRITAAITGLLLAIWDIFVNVLGSIVMTLFDMFGLGGGKIASKIQDFLGYYSDSLRTNIDEQRAMAEELDALSNSTHDNSNSWAEYAKRMKAAKDETAGTVSVLDKAGNVIGKLTGKADGASGGLTSMISAFTSSKGIDTSKFDVGLETSEEIQNYSQAQKDAMVKAGVGTYGDNGEGFYVFKQIAKEDVAGAESIYSGANLEFPGVDMSNMDNIPDEYKDMMSQTGYDGGIAFEDAQAAGFYDGQSEVLAACDNNSSAQIQAIKDTYGDMHKAGKGQTEAQAGGIEDGYMDMYHAGNKTLDGFKLPWNTFSGASSVVTGSGANVGYNAVMSIYGGMEEAMNVLPEGMKGMFQQAFDETEANVIGPKQWDMHSPSKTTERWGQMIIAGLSNGIYDATPEAVTSMTELSNSMISSFTNPLDYVARVASGELTYDPSIRPILDTSSISTGAYGIRSMFDNQNVTLSGFSGKLAADITELDTTNTQVVSELKALRNDMNVMTEQIAGMQIIMDSGQLVGAIAPGMDDALGRRAIHRGRGN